MNARIFATSLLLAGCATQHEVITTEKHNGQTTIHHRKRTHDGSIDRIEAIDAKGIVTEAEIHVYDVGRLPDGSGGINEAHRYYRIVQDSYSNLQLPKKVVGGPKTILTSPAYSPPPSDQRINDAVDEAKQAKKRIENASEKLEQRLSEDNNLRGELQQAKDDNQRLQDQINAGFNTIHKPTEAEKAAQDAVNPLAEWGKNSK